MKNPAFMKNLTYLLFLPAAYGCGGGENTGILPSHSMTNADGNNSHIFVEEGGCVDLRGKNEVTLTWGMPTINTDGTPLLDLAGFLVYYGRQSQGYDSQQKVGLNTSPTIYNLEPGAWYFSVTSFNTARLESNFSKEVCGVL